ncbi:MAG TPA: glycine oxidase ThiO [Blastocatellia bacterium]|nr:glycine oxidase ThiO [Blastocatellia bacterium]
MNQVNHSFDVAIIGGGVMGCAIAWQLGQAGARVLVIERGEIGHEASWAAGGMLAPLSEANQADAFFELAVASRAMYADFARELYEITGIDIEYRTEGTVYLALTDQDEAELEQRWQWQRAAGLRVEKLSAEQVRALEPMLTPRLRWALKFPDDHQVNNRRLMTALEAAVRAVGVEFWTNTEATALEISNAQVSGIETTKKNVATNTVVVAAGSWASLLKTRDGAAAMDFSVEPIRGQMIALEMPTPPLQHIVYSGNGYLIPRLSGQVIAGSTTESVGYDNRVTAEGIASIIARATEIAPALRQQTLLETWSGLRPKTKDEWPILGMDSRIRGLVYATGHYRNGILLAPITARVISDLVLRGASSTTIEPFSPIRFHRCEEVRRSA